jgi:GT2 family glycosyltransferase
MRFSIVVLTYNRKDVLAELLGELSRLDGRDTEVVVVDNCSTDGTEELVRDRFPSFRIVRTPCNQGAVGRNWGMAVAGGTFVVTIDDDILGLDAGALEAMAAFFTGRPRAGAICFRVLDHYTGGVCNWCHPRDPEKFSQLSFETNEITEGAVVFRKDVLDQVGLYPDEFFISHEGADLAARIIDRGYEIHYSPEITVSHKYAQNARPGWRRYYYDARNDFWLAFRNYRPLFIVTHLLRRLPVTFLYALRDGFLAWWVQAVKDGILHLPRLMKQRRPIARETHAKLRHLNSYKPGLSWYLKRRLFVRRVKI